MDRSYIIPFNLVLLLSACPDPRQPESNEDGIGVDAGDEVEGEGETLDDEGALPDIKLDTATDEAEGTADSGDHVGESCKKVDLLFVIDDSGSMSDEQVNLVSSFPSFISEIQTQLADTESYHIGIITSDLYAFDSSCPQEGAMIMQTGGDDSSDAVCGPYAAGHRYMTEQDDLDEAFACAAQVGTDGDGNERPMQTMIAALSPALNGPGGCNEGFLRDDALLVVVLITDEEDDHEVDGCQQQAQPGSNGEPPDWYQGVIAAKAGVETNVVVLSLVGPPGPDPAMCPTLDKCSGGIEGAEVASRIVEFTSMFTNGFIGRVCEPSYAGFFSEAVGVIKSACDDFEPIQ